MIIPLLACPTLSGAAENDHFTEGNDDNLRFLGEVFLAGAQHLDPKPYSKLLTRCSCRVGPFNPAGADESVTDTIVNWLDLGAYRAVIEVSRPLDNSAVKELVAWAQLLPDARHRLVALVKASDLGQDSFDSDELEALISTLSSGFSVIQFDLLDSLVALSEVARRLLPLRGKEGSKSYVELSISGVDSLAAEDIGDLHLKSAIDVVTSCHIPADGVTGGKGVDAAAAFFHCLRSDRPDGMIPTVVCDTSGVAMGLVYSNSLSIAASLACGRGVYWSRSRQGLWRKGDTSGSWQALHSIETDCDSDALRFRVVQHGDPPAFCHFNRRACWRADGGLGALERTLVARKAAAPPGSYTARLFNDPVLLRNKLVEEAQELAEATSPEDVAAEAADVAYFMLARCVAAGVGVADIESWLDRRALKMKRRPGNSKPERIIAGDAILSASMAANPVINI